MQITLVIDTKGAADMGADMSSDELDAYFQQNEDGCRQQMAEAALGNLIEQAAD